MTVVGPRPARPSVSRASPSDAIPPASSLLAGLVVVLLVTVAITATAPVTSAQEHHANDTSRHLSNDLVAPGGSITVETTVVFDEPTSGQLTETVDPAVADIAIVDADGADTVTVFSDESGIRASYSDRTEITLVYELTFDQAAQGGDTYTIEGTFDNGEQRSIAADEVTVSEGPIFEVTSLDAPSRVPPGEPFDIEIQVTNTGLESDTQTVNIWVDDEHLGSTDDVALDPGQSITLRFDDLQIDEPREYRLHVDTDQHRRSHELTIESFAAFEVDDIRAPGVVTVVDEFFVTATVTNVGDLADTQDVHLEVDGERVRTADAIAIEPGSTQDVLFESIRIEETGEHELSVVTDNTTLTTTVVVTEATITANLADQIVGIDPAGDRAIVVEGVTADAGWSLIVTYEDDTGTPIVAGATEIDADIEDATVPVRIEADAAVPGEVELVVVNRDGDTTVGEPLHDEVEVLLRTSATLFSGSIEVYDQSFDDETDSITVERAALFDAEGTGETPYIIGLYRIGPDGEAEIVGQSAPIWGEVEAVTINLNRRLETEGDHRFVLRFHHAVVGQRGDPIPILDGTSTTTFDESFTVRIIDTPRFAIQGINRPSSVDHDESLAIDITLTNQGVAAGTQTVWVSIGDWVELVDVTLAPGETTTVTITWEPDGAGAGEYALLIDTGDDSDLSAIQVNGNETTPAQPANPIPGFDLTIGVVGLMLALLGYAVYRRRHV